MKTRMMSVALGLLLPVGALADACPPSPNDFDTWTWIQSANSGDDWVTDLVCTSAAHRDAVKNMVATYAGLYANWDAWESMLSGNKICNPDKWGARTINGGHACEIVGDHRDNESFEHFASPGGELPDGTPIKHWLSQFAAYYISEEGYDWECLGDDDEPGPDDGFLYASNPWNNSSCTFYYPWFWNKTVMDRASTIVHEASHEFEGHIGDDECTGGGSCDTAFMDANAQTFQIIFDAQAVDAYQKKSNGELEVVNFGNDVCGYLPLLPDLDRFALLNVMRSKLKKNFKTVPPQSQYPDSAVLDSVPGTLYDLAGNPGGKANTAYRIDITNQARWACDQVCDPADYVFNAQGGSGKRACNETWQAGNAAVNANNRAQCTALNAQVAAGVTPQEHSQLRSQVYALQGCIPGMSDAFLAATCDTVIPGAQHIDDIAQSWPLPEDVGYGYSAEEAVRDCQITFCSRQDLDTWDMQASDMCYAWDDAAGCMDLLCGDLDALDPEPGVASQAYFERVMCRAAELGRRLGLREDDVGCQAQFNDCMIREEYLPLWQDQLVDGECWSAGLRDNDPLHLALRRQLGLMPAERFVIADRAPGLLSSQCILEETQCEALQASMRAIAARIAAMKTKDRLPWEQPPGPDPWERQDRLADTFDRDFERALVGMSEQLDAGPLWRNADLRRAAMPEAQVATAELIGLDTWFRIGGARYAGHLFSPERLQRFSGAEADPYGLPIDGFEAELDALETFVRNTSTRQWAALESRAPALGGLRYYAHLDALLAARTGTELLTAQQALQADLEALGR